jgi:transposase
MTTTVTREKEANRTDRTLHVALEVSEKKWKLAFTTGLGQKPRVRDVTGGDVGQVVREIGQAKRRFKLEEKAPVVSCYEAGMDGFWIHRALEASGVKNVVVDSSSIDVKRRRRRAKTDKLDARALVAKLVQYESGQREVWSVVRVPAEEAEDLRHTHRELDELTGERTALVSELRGLLKTQGIRLGRLRAFPEQLKKVRRWDGAQAGPELRARLLRLWERVEMVEKQIEAVQDRRSNLMEQEREGKATGVVAKTVAKAQQLLRLKAVGPRLSWALATEVFGWRTFDNRRQLASLLGLVPVPNQSGDAYREHGISKAGNAQLRSQLIELAWLWLRYQPNSALSQWYNQKFAQAGRRMRRIGIVALARKLVIELWKFLETAALPEGAHTKA